jgi:hypothetical protein
MVMAIENMPIKAPVVVGEFKGYKLLAILFKGL